MIRGYFFWKLGMGKFFRIRLWRVTRARVPNISGRTLSRKEQRMPAIGNQPSFPGTGEEHAHGLFPFFTE